MRNNDVLLHDIILYSLVHDLHNAETHRVISIYIDINTAISRPGDIKFSNVRNYSIYYIVTRIIFNLNAFECKPQSTAFILLSKVTTF